jgi:hypothetical protein
MFRSVIDQIRKGDYVCCGWTPLPTLFKIRVQIEALAGGANLKLRRMELLKLDVVGHY